MRQFSKDLLRKVVLMGNLPRKESTDDVDEKRDEKPSPTENETSWRKQT